jgi:hypothetical protein
VRRETKAIKETKVRQEIPVLKANKVHVEMLDLKEYKAYQERKVRQENGASVVSKEIVESKVNEGTWVLEVLKV